MNEKYQVFIKTDTKNRVIEINSSAFIGETADWLQIDEGDGDKYHHAQGNYLDKPIVDFDGARNYMYENENLREATKAEKQAEKAAFPLPPPTETERLEAAESALMALMGGVANV